METAATPDMVGPGFSWMAWTWQTGVFFGAIGLLLAVMTTLAIVWPEVPRRGILRFPTTRGDRLFVTLLLAAIVHLVWIGLGRYAGLVGLSGDAIWPPLIASVLIGAAMFRWA